MDPGQLAPITTPAHSILTGNAVGIVPNILDSTGVTYSVVVSDGTRTETASTFIKGIYPYFYGIVSNTVSQSLLLQNLNKKVEYLGEQIVSVSGSGSSNSLDFYFMYDSDYPNLAQVIDDVGNDVTSYFTGPLIQTKVSPQGLWNTKDYKIYKWSMTTPISNPVNYKFIHLPL
jgi:hypothetical protein